MNSTVGDITDFYREHPEFIGELDVETQHGYKTIQYADITAVDSPILKIETSNKTIECSLEHKLWAHGWTHANKLIVGDSLDTKDGFAEIISIKELDFTEDLYDLQVEDVHEFYANGFVSHNSTLTDSLTYALFGTAFRSINNEQLINSINNKDCRVEVEFSIGTNEFKIERGMKPKLLKIYKNGKVLNQDATRVDQQKYIEEHVLQFSKKVFTQIVVLGSSSFVPFMQLKAKTRREVIGSILDIGMFDIMYTVLKERASGNSLNLVTLEKDIDKYKSNILIYNENIKRIEDKNKNQVADNKEKVEEFEDDLSLLESHKEFKVRQRDELLSDTVDNNKLLIKKKTLTQYKNKIENNLNNENQKICFHDDNSSCPHCEQEIEPKFKKKTVKRCRDKISKFQEGLDKIKTQEADVDLELSKITDILTQVDTMNGVIRDFDMNINTLNSSIKILQSQNTEILEDDESINEVSDKIKLVQTDLDTSTGEYEESIELSEKYNVCLDMLTDQGIKLKIINYYLPIINASINKYLRAMEFFINFSLDSSFKETIMSRYRDEFSYSSFSEGEKYRIDVALLLTWREIAAMRNSASTNILILDEVFDSSLDEDGTDDFLKLLEALNDTNIFVISHRRELADKFDRTLHFKTIQNFSIMEEE